MNYFDLNCVKNAYDNFQKKLTNKSWGLLCVMKQLDKTIEPGQTYTISGKKLSEYIEKLFCLSTGKVYKDNAWYVKFSSQWYDFFIQQSKGVKPNIFDAIVWAYRKEHIQTDLSYADLIKMFAEDFHIESGLISAIFDTTPRTLSYDTNLYTEANLKSAILAASASDNITAEKTSVAASVGELSRGPFIQPLYGALENSAYFLISQVDFDKMYPFNGKKAINSSVKNLPRQQIFYGAPGTGKSNTIKREVDEKGGSCIRTTFHPDSDYSTFVGAYKPTTTKENRYGLNGGTTVTLVNPSNKEPLHETRIEYKFVKQAFLKAYIKAWKFFADTKEEDTMKKQYLIIEEINRGNCAQIFGDLFQLLDRTDSHFSEYPIEADEDICKTLKCIDSIDDPSFGENGLQFTPEQITNINSQYDKNGINQNVAEKLSKGEVLVLPPNLYIWATMNTSDQSLFPIDSAFKRRWEWKYVPIYDCKKDWRIEGDTNEFDWWSFLEKINTEIGELTHSEDKKLGYFFCKADSNGIISADKFVSKVIFYLWNDVFKDYDFESKIFKDGEDGILSFNKFYHVDKNGNIVVRKDKVQLFLETNLELGTVDEEEDDDGNTSSSTSRNYDKFSINGAGRYAKNRLAENCVKEYIKNNSTMSADDVVKNWKELESSGSIVPHFIESEDTFNARTDKGKDRSTKISCGSTFIYVAHDGYGANGKVEKLIEAVNNKDWGLTLARV